MRTTTTAPSLAELLRAATGPPREPAAARLLDPAEPADRAALRALLDPVDGGPATLVVDTVEEQLAELVRTRAPDRDLDAEQVREGVDALLAGCAVELFGRWVHHPWARRLVHVLPAALHRELRLDRNRHKITSAEQDVLLGLTIAIAGLSVGRAVAQTLVREGIGAEFRLADFDALSLSNLNRVAGGVADVGVNKAVLAAREVVELDPYVQVTTLLDGVRPDGVDAFLAGADVLLDECDDLEVKLLLRERAAAAGIPVVMVTSDRGLLDVERFDREPDRAPFHGALGGVTAADLRGLTSAEKVPYVLRILDARRLEPRSAASLVEVRQTLSTWPQLASDVTLGGAVAANAVRRIALGELTASGRYEVDLAALVRDGGGSPTPPPGEPRAVVEDEPTLVFPQAGGGALPSTAELRFVAECATLAPSGGNAQPWRFTARDGQLYACLDPARATTALDVDDRANRMALGAALEAAAIGARALGFSPVAGVPQYGPEWRLDLRRSGHQERTADLALLVGRCCRRSTSASGAVAADVLAALAATADPLRASPVTDLAAVGDALGELDRVRFLSPELHRELVGEIRWTRADAMRSRDGIDIATFGLDAAELAALDVLRSPAVMAELRQLDRGHALGAITRKALRTAGAALVLSTPRTDRVAMVEAGRGLMRLWLAATAQGIGVHPFGMPLLVARCRADAGALDAWGRAQVEAAGRVLDAVAAQADETVLMVLRLAPARDPVVRSVRRPVDAVFEVAG